MSYDFVLFLKDESQFLCWYEHDTLPAFKDILDTFSQIFRVNKEGINSEY